MVSNHSYFKGLEPTSAKVRFKSVSNPLLSTVAIASRSLFSSLRSSNTVSKKISNRGAIFFVRGRNQRVQGTSGNDTLNSSKGKGNNWLFGGAGNDQMLAGRKDSLFGDKGNDILDARDGRGKNLLSGGSGNDTLYAKRSDRLNGGTGNDTLWSGDGNNRLIGGSGSDQFWIVNGELPKQKNVISDFVSGVDVIGIQNLPGIRRFSELSFTQQGKDTIISYGGQEIVALLSVSSTSVDRNSFVFTPVLPEQIDPVAPVLSVDLADDTGSSSSDRSTSNPNIKGIVRDTSFIPSLRASFGNGTPESFINITPALLSDRSFTLNRRQLEAIQGSSLSDGTYTLRLVAEDFVGNESGIFNFEFRLDTVAPTISAQVFENLFDSALIVSGTLVDASNISSLRVKIDNAPQQSFVEINSFLNVDNSFTLDKEQLERIAGTSFDSGTYNIQLVAVDTVGNISNIFNLPFEIFVVPEVPPATVPELFPPDMELPVPELFPPGIALPPIPELFPPGIALPPVPLPGQR